MAYQDAPNPPVTDELRAACEGAMHVITHEGPVYVGHESVLFVYDALGYGAPVAVLRLPPFRWFTPLVYRWIANNRRTVAQFVFTTRDEAPDADAR